MIAVFWLVLVLIVLPFGTGWLLIPGASRSQIYLTGMCASWGLYEILALLFHCALWPLSVMTGVWVGICAAAACVGFYRRRRDLRGMWDLSSTGVTRAEGFLSALVILLVLVQALHVALSTFYGNWDDSTYCAIATTSWYTNTANRCSPNTGTPGGILYGGKYVLAFWPVFSASLAQLTGIHPAIVFRTLMPLFEIPLAYGIAWLLARFFFPKDRKKALWAIVVLNGITLVAAEKMGQNCAEWWLKVNPWTGKAIASNIMVPLILWILFHLEETAGMDEQCLWWCSLFMACLASCMVAGTMFVLVPAELAVWGIFYLFRTRRWKDVGYFLVCGTPALTCTLLIYWTQLLRMLRGLF